MVKPNRLSRFAIFAWIVLAANLGVILWGAYVRASGSGAGCGSHWPLCNGVVIPPSPAVATVIEFTHRLSSGLALILVVILLGWALRAYPKRHLVRRGAGFVMLFMLTEALLGAGLVLFEWVAQDASLGRAIAMAAHLVNTFLLLASLSLTAWWASGGQAVSFKNHGAAVWGLGVAYLGVIALGVTGAITALGDTLFPSSSLAEGMQQDFSATANFLIRFRVWHPVIAITLGLYVLFIALLIGMGAKDLAVKRLVWAIAGLFVAQLSVGLVNLVLLAPIPIQIIHLLMADLVWITLVLLGAAYFGVAPEESTVRQPGVKEVVEEPALG